MTPVVKPHEAVVIQCDSPQEVQVVHATVAVLQQMSTDLPSLGTWSYALGQIGRFHGVYERTWSLKETV